MRTTAKYETIWIGVILIFTILFFGVVTRFNYGEINLQIHDTNLVIPLLLPLTLIFLWLTLLVIAIREIKYNFNRKKPIMILLINNFLTLLLTSLIIYGLFALSTTVGIIDAFMNEHNDKFYSPLFELYKYVEWLTFVVPPLLISFEIYLFIKLKRLKKIHLIKCMINSG